MAEPLQTYEAELVDQQVEWSLTDLCAACRVEQAWVLELVEHGVIEPIGAVQESWRFAGLSVIHVGRAKRLGGDLGLNVPGIALALQLLDEIDALRAHVARFEQMPRKAGD